VKNFSRQQGIALLVFVTLLATAAAAVTVTALNRSSQNVHIARDKITAAALAQAKEALIGRAVTDENHPGSLPCPDTNNNGIAEIMSALGNNCPSYIGRLPWRTLGLPELRDGSRELLWYALSDRFRDIAAAEPINSDTVGNRHVFAPDGTTELTNQAIAIIFSSGDALAGQNRDANTSVHCLATGTTILRNRCANNYLEAANDRNNATQTGPFITGPVRDANGNTILNDHLLFITHENLFPSVEKVVGKRVRELLNVKRTTWGVFPFAAPFGDPDDSSTLFKSTSNTDNGWLPFTTSQPVWVAPPSFSLAGGSADVACELREGNNSLENARARCYTSNILGTPTITLTGDLDYFCLWQRKYDLSNVDEVRVRVNGDNYAASSVAGMNADISYTVNANGRVTVVFTGNLVAGVERIELRDVPVPADTTYDWLVQNEWHHVTYYAVSPGYAPGGINDCEPLGTLPHVKPYCLTVTGNGGGNDKHAVVITTGKALTNQSSHPSGNLTDYLEEENAPPSDFTYENRNRSDAFNDQVIVVAP
jgi:hypothetical protein